MLGNIYQTSYSQQRMIHQQSLRWPEEPGVFLKEKAGSYLHLLLQPCRDHLITQHLLPQRLCRVTHRPDHRARDPDFPKLLQEQLYWVYTVAAFSLFFMLFHRHFSAIALSEAATHVTILSTNTHLTFCSLGTAWVQGALFAFNAPFCLCDFFFSCCLSHQYIFNGYNILWQEVSQQVMARNNPSCLFWACQLLVSFDGPNFVLTVYVHSSFKATNSMQRI